MSRWQTNVDPSPANRDNTMSQVDLTAKLCLSFCLDLQPARSTCQHVDLDLY